jgi:phosphoserine aminotransferase
MLYDYIDNSEGYYSNPVELKYRSRTNIPFRVKKDDKLETKFLSEA